MENESNDKNSFTDFFSDRAAASKGRVFILDLSPVQDQLKERWERLKGQVYATAKDVIDHRIRPDDVYCQWDEKNYLIAFGALDEARARIKINLIAQEITQRLLGSPDPQNAITVTMATADENGHFFWQKDTDPSKLVEEEENPLAPIKQEDTRNTQALVHQDVEFIFRPLWFVKNKIISSYFCIPVRPQGSGRFLSSYNVLSDHLNPVAVEALDLLTMKRIFVEASKLDEIKNPALLTVPIHFESIASTGRRSILLKQCQKNLAPHRGRIVVELTHLPDGIPQSRLQDLIQALKPFSRAVMARFDSMHRDFAGYKHVGLHAVGVDLYDDRRSEVKIMNDMELFAASAAKHGLHTYVHGVRSISLTTAAICSGIDYVDGYAITDVQEGARDVKYYSIRMPYAAKYSEAKE
ncbi:hypothetical protein MTBPR1_150049 [Candidatus Terasakiella magnetica]|uniref:EAL domain-containing protein n=1 Tax=Candidatus Terasakiella magnetica TaxID=1867952 RepID=A0A1C3RFK8_9PROT|nr:hypothetical protein [Candidatus Terasakiella magnetica]SCA56002.1 hypothetical protein MTBPR1_150049 [Candidatus Terasakiella magnetica]